MVKIYCGRDCISYTLEELSNATAGDVITKMAKGATQAFLTRAGNLFSNDVCLSNLGIGENDVLRVMFKEEETKAIKAMFSETTLKECYKMFDSLHKEQSGYAYVKLIDEISEPDFLRKQLKEHPELSSDPEACQTLNDYHLMATSLSADDEKSEMLLKFHTNHPALMTALTSLLRKHIERLKDSGSRVSSLRLPDTGPTQSAALPVITHDMLRQAMAFAYGGPTANVSVPSLSPSGDRNSELRARYSAELAQLIDFGFTDELTNLSVLETSNGNVEMALELLITMREDI